MDQFLNWLAGLPHSVWIAGLAPLVLTASAAAARRPKRPDASGWIKVEPTLAILALTALSVLFIVAFSIFLFAAIMVIAQNGLEALVGENGRTLSFACLLAPPLISLFSYSAAYTFLMRHRFNEHGVEERILGRDTFTAWPDISAITRHWLFGPRLKLRSGKAIQLSEYYRGFQQLVEQAAAKGVAIDF